MTLSLCWHEAILSIPSSSRTLLRVDILKFSGLSRYKIEKLSMFVSWSNKNSRVADGIKLETLSTKLGMKASRLFKDLLSDKMQSYLDCNELKLGLIKKLDLSSLSTPSEHEIKINKIKNEDKYLNKCFQSDSLLR